MEPDFNKMELIPAIIQDVKTKEVLMLAYVNKESYEYMIKNKQTCFYSRSRKKLWIKGETSGNFQYIKELHLDCDNDTLLIKVEQVGNACHTGSYTCFYKPVINSEKENYNNSTIKAVYEKICDRAINPVENSYTNYLLEKGTDKICKKVGEEATETVIAAKNESKEELVGEICDLIYHTLVLMYDRGIGVEDVENLLAKRQKIDGNKKKFNVRGEY